MWAMKTSYKSPETYEWIYNWMMLDNQLVWYSILKKLADGMAIRLMYFFKVQSCQPFPRSMLEAHVAHSQHRYLNPLSWDTSSIVLYTVSSSFWDKYRTLRLKSSTIISWVGGSEKIRSVSIGAHSSVIVKYRQLSISKQSISGGTIPTDSQSSSDKHRFIRWVHFEFDWMAGSLIFDPCYAKNRGRIFGHEAENRIISEHPTSKYTCEV